MTSKKANKYCGVFKCFKTNGTNPELSFFQIPADKETRLKWLRLIDREELSQTSANNILVCQSHFKPEDISVNPNRKVVRKHCFPSLHLPKNRNEANNTSVSTETQTDIPTCSVACETMKIIRSDNITQTTKALSADSPRKRKLKSELSDLKKRLRLAGIGAHSSGKSQKDLFVKLCDHFLSKDFAEIVKAQVFLKSNYSGNRYTLAYKMFCLNMYFISPQAYLLLQQSLCLPCKNTLHKLYIPITTQVNDDLMAVLKLKFNNMSDKEKQCSLVLKAMSLKTNLFYDINHDKIIGFHEVDGVQSPSPAKYALVVLVRGIFVKWSQAIGFALISECKIDDSISKWIDKIILKLFDVGLKIRVFVSDMGLDLLNAARKRGISVENTYFIINDHKIYYIFDTPNLMKLLCDNFMTYDFYLQNNRVAKHEHIVKFYEDDKDKTFRQAYKLTTSHINPISFEKMEVRYATQLLSRSVAVGMSTYIDFKLIDESARHTVEFIQNINDLFDLLNSSTYRHSYVYKSAFSGSDNQIDFFNNMLILFQTLKLYNSNGNDVTKTGKFIDGFQITIKSILNLYEDLKQEGFKYLLTRRLNQDIIENFFEKIRSKNGMTGEPTCRQFIFAYNKIYFANITQALREDNCTEDLTKFLVNLKSHENFETGAGEIDELTNSNDNNQTHEQGNVLREISRSDYSEFQVPEKNAFFYICGALLKKCVDFHTQCNILKLYADVSNFSSETRYTHYKNYGADNKLPLIPPDDFIANIERMEQVFKEEFEKEHINIKIGSSIYERLKIVEFTMPCPCFPKSYLHKLYIRMRIYFTLTANNKAFRSSKNRRKKFSVSNL